MGTPEFAVTPLQAIKSAGMNIVGVVTAPDKPAGRGKKLTSPAVKCYADESLDCPVFQPEKLKDPAFIRELAGLKADLFIVVAFRMLPEAVWTLPEHGTINLHASLLPQYRGAAPINWCIINGEKETGLTTFLIDREIDTGKILLQEKMSVGPDENAGELHDRMTETGAELLVRTIEQVMAGTIAPVPQEAFNIPAEQLKKAPKIFPPDCQIDWSMGSEQIHNLVRGMSPFPGAFTRLTNPEGNMSTLKIFATDITRAEKEKEAGTGAGTTTDANTQAGKGAGSGAIKGSADRAADGAADGAMKGVVDGSVKGAVAHGTLRSDQASFLEVKTGDGWLELKTLQAEGKKRMPLPDFLRGFRGDINECMLQ